MYLDDGRRAVTVAFFGLYFWITDGIFSRLYVVANNYFHHH
jgi:hypothetical protein